MALRKSKDDKRTAEPAAGGGVATEERPGESVEECVALGQALVESGHLPTESLAEALTDGKGELWPFGEIVLTKYGVGRSEYAAALGEACGLPVADPRNATVDLELGAQVEESVARKFYFIPVGEQGGKLLVWGADCSKTKRDAAEAASGKKFEWLATDPKTVTSYMEQMWRSDADIGRVIGYLDAVDNEVTRDAADLEALRS